MNQPLLQIVVGGQYGSEAKGHVAAQLAARLKEPLVIRTGGPNAGHTVVGPDGRTHKLRQLPTAVVSNPGAQLGISAGSLIDSAVLKRELIEQGLTPERLIVDQAATIIERAHKDAEQGNESLANWSTQKGIGAARADRIWRRAQTVNDYYQDHFEGWFQQASVGSVARGKLAMGEPVLIEAAQGYGLGLHTPYYPKTTSADCTAIDALADVGLSPWAIGPLVPRIWVVLRPYPIRVAGSSGPLVGETTWGELGLEPERTTVTNKIRRVGRWDPNLAAEAIWANGGPAPNVVAALTMADQVVPAVRGMTTVDDLRTLTEHDTLRLQRWVERVQTLGAQVRAIGTGPATMVFLDELKSEIRIPADAAIHRGGE